MTNTNHSKSNTENIELKIIIAVFFALLFLVAVKV